ncbi:MAG: SPOR domain-containing protein [Candidatus Omnitrophica bacterium]|nr:SPOR domain-containing protein [Candidatus Omnitrophota bacterium]
MEDQKELFPEFKPDASKKKLPLAGLMPEKTITLVLTRDKLVLWLLGIIIVIATAFAFGSERGKRSGLPKAVAVKTVTIKQAVKTQPAAIQAKQRPYTILAATFKSKQYAQDAAAGLRAKGFPTVIIGINGLYEVYAGEFSDYKEASRGLAIVSKTHKGCQIRKR